MVELKQFWNDTNIARLVNSIIQIVFCLYHTNVLCIKKYKYFVLF